MGNLTTDQDRTGDSRARELFHYFQPDNPAMLPTSQVAACDASSSLAANNKGSPNLVLTALAQLAAVKLQAQRAIISLIGRETLYVVAEASRSLDLTNPAYNPMSDDGLWMGCSNGPVTGTLCEVGNLTKSPSYEDDDREGHESAGLGRDALGLATVALEATPEQPHPFFVVQDLQEHPKYHQLPCVAGSPHFRFYAGTPLKTTNGVNIGSLYVIDPRPHLELNTSHQTILGGLADTIMEYLETSRQSLEANRLTKLLAGLNTFVQGEAEPDSWSTSASSSVFPPTAQWEARNRSSSVTSQSAIEDAGKVRPSPSPSPSSSPSPSVIESTAIKPASTPAATSRTTSRSKADMARSLTDRTDRTFQRAAKTIRESLELGSHGGVVIVGTTDGADEDFNEGSDEDKERTLAKVWATSRSNASSGTVENDPEVLPAIQMDSRFVRRMIRRHPRGGLWYFQDEALSLSSDEDGGYSEGSKVSSHPPPPYSSWASTSDRLREKDLRALETYFPKASRIIFCPLWDTLNSRWFGACFCWSSAETRVFSTHVDLGGLIGFGSSLMVEHSRIRSQESAVKKGDFISTISHEMRSPLHGILGANELLSEHIRSEFGLRLLDTIRACGQTLLDTFEQILDFAKINSFDRNSKRPRSPHRAGPHYVDQKSRRAQSYHLWKLVNVVSVVEDAVESVYSGQLMSGSLARKSAWGFNQETDTAAASGTVERQRLELDVIIEAPAEDWLYLVEAGALRRIVMNVFGNAIKYTEHGSITLHLETQRPKKGSPLLILTVSDTGRGISHDYLHSKIFTPFSQEDSMSPGTGLGLSLVRDILRSLNGSITIKSQLGVGTVVRMAFPILDPTQPDSSTVKPTSPVPSPPLPDALERVREKLAGKSAVILTPPDGKMSAPLRTIGQYATEWLGMSMVPSLTTFPTDVIIVDELNISSLPDAHRAALILILCHRRPELWNRMKATRKQLPNSVWITLPCGPQQLARSIQAHWQAQALESSAVLAMMPEGAQLTAKLDPKQPKNILHPPSPLSSQDLQQRLDSGSKAPCVDDELSDLPEQAAALSLRPIDALTTQASRQSTSVSVIDHASKLGRPLPARASSSLRILLVEDNAINLALLSKFVSRLNPATLDTAVDGAKAVEQVLKMPDGYHFILMDLSMPVMDGFTATQKIRSIENDRGTSRPATIIALTGLGSSEHIRKAYSAGVNVFLRKPFSFKDIKGIFEHEAGKSEVT
ncbi:hypothetical protein N7539_009504 [Penicillium diatomitis]|uniref:histidine kinase n=1 Tax=Penicillium diatomitis TaxID=2819901 RepID=A0A9W9WK65_9EURO|nr:uncharacterized protein N7539_009504 [Penicillium diatomitis]KAJ5466548.1 hypothetical protein N7539_009504 [Penicillium diatomitis]